MLHGVIGRRWLHAVTLCAQGLNKLSLWRACKPEMDNIETVWGPFGRARISFQLSSSDKGYSDLTSSVSNRGFATWPWGTPPDLLQSPTRQQMARRID